MADKIEFNEKYFIAKNREEKIKLLIDQQKF